MDQSSGASERRGNQPGTSGPGGILPTTASELMHELSIAMSIVELAEEEAGARGVGIRAVHLRLGPLSGVVKRALLSAYELACEQTILEGSQLIIEEVPIEEAIAQKLVAEEENNR